MECAIFRDQDPRWDSFVLAHPAGTFFHLSVWREILERSFGYQPIYLYVEEKSQIVGILPLFLVKSWIFGRSLVAMPVGVYGGILAVDDDTSRMLLEKATQLAQEYKVRYLEIRGNPYLDGAAIPGANGSASRWSRKDLYVTFLNEIEPTEEANLARIPRKQRRMVRQGGKYGLRAIFDNERVREFYDVYAESVRNLGTPVYGFQYFKILLEALGDRCKILLVEHQGRAVAGVMSFFYKDQVLPYYGGALKQFFQLAPNDFMYWELLRYAATRGCKTFDFGRSKEGTGSYDFKRHWGFDPKPLPYWYYTLNGHGAPDTSPLNPKLQWAIRIWRSLPLKLTTTLGPHVVRHIP
ncbi:MAG TPA: FemAB family XrtA/PEP-CTERM system-associated protein [Candidatus Binatia bacterium]|nr:FemAB family XrtA/PEP-CTERM system-associated protein [Candidatus Binatia bacterium]